MRKSKFSEGQIVAILKEGEAGLAVAEVCRKHARYQCGDLLRLEEQIRRQHGERPDAHARVGSRERSAQTNVRRSRAGERRHQGRALAKVVAPSAKRQVVQLMTHEYRLPIKRACEVAGLSRAAYYREPVDRLTRDGELIDALNGVVERNSRWGFWKCFQRASGRSAMEPQARLARVLRNGIEPAPAHKEERAATRSGPTGGRRAGQLGLGAGLHA